MDDDSSQSDNDVQDGAARPQHYNNGHGDRCSSTATPFLLDRFKRNVGSRQINDPSEKKNNNASNLLQHEHQSLSSSHRKVKKKDHRKTNDCKQDIFRKKLSENTFCNYDQNQKIPCNKINTDGRNKTKLNELNSENAQLKGELQALRDEGKEKEQYWSNQMKELEGEIERLHESGRVEREIWKREKKFLESQPTKQNSNFVQDDLLNISQEAVRLEEELNAVIKERDELLCLVNDFEERQSNKNRDLHNTLQSRIEELTETLKDRNDMIIKHENQIQQLQQNNLDNDLVICDQEQILQDMEKVMEQNENDYQRKIAHMHMDLQEQLNNSRIDNGESLQLKEKVRELEEKYQSKEREIQNIKLEESKKAQTKIQQMQQLCEEKEKAIDNTKSDDQQFLQAKIKELEQMCEEQKEIIKKMKIKDPQDNLKISSSTDLNTFVDSTISIEKKLSFTPEKDNKSSRDRRAKLFEAKKLLSSKYVSAAKVAQKQLTNKGSDLSNKKDYETSPSEVESVTSDCGKVPQIDHQPSDEEDNPKKLRSKYKLLKQKNDENIEQILHLEDKVNKLEKKRNSPVSLSSQQQQDKGKFHVFSTSFDSLDHTAGPSTVTYSIAPLSPSTSKSNFLLPSNNNPPRVNGNENNSNISLRQELEKLLQILDTHLSKLEIERNDTRLRTVDHTMSVMTHESPTITDNNLSDGSLVKLIYKHFKELCDKLSSMEQEVGNKREQNEDLVGQIENAIVSPGSQILSPPRVARYYESKKEESDNGDEIVIAKLNRVIKERDESNQTLKNKLIEAIDLIKPLKAHISACENEKRKLNDQLVSLQNKIETEINSRKETTVMEKVDDETQYPVTRRIAKQLLGQRQTEIDEVQQKVITDLQTKLNEKSLEVDGMKAQLQILESKRLSDTNLHSSRVSELLQEIETLRADLELAYSKTESNATELKTLFEAKENKLLEEKNAVQKKHVSTEQELQRMRDVLKGNNESLKKKDESISDIEAQLIEQTDILRQYACEKDELRERLDIANKKLIDQATELPMVKKNLKIKTESEAVLRKRLKEAIDLLKPLKHHLQTAEKEKQDVYAKLIQAQIKIEALEKISSQVQSISTSALISSEKYKKQSKYYEAAVKRLIEEKLELEDSLENFERIQQASEINKTTDYDTVSDLRDHLRQMIELYKATKSMLDEVTATNQNLLEDLKQSEDDEIETAEELEILRKKLIVTNQEMENAKYIATSALMKLDELTGNDYDNLSWFSGAEESDNSPSRLSNISEEESNRTANTTKSKIRGLVECLSRLEQQMGELVSKNTGLESSIVEKNQLLQSLLNQYSNGLDWQKDIQIDKS